MGALAAGSLLGGLLYGARTWRGSLGRRYVFLNAVFAVGMAPLIVAGAIPVMVVLMAVAGLALAPVSACAFGLIEQVAPPGTTTEAFTWLFTANMTGAAAGAAAAGTVIHSSGIRAALLIPVCGVAVSFLVALGRRRTLEPLPAAIARRTAATARAVEAAVAAGSPVLAGVAGAGEGPSAADGSPATGVNRVPGALPGAMPGRIRGPGLLAAGLVIAAALLGYRARDGRPDSHRRTRRR
jgi:MFS family permease